MKKYSTHFFSFLLVFTVFLISGCSSDSDDNADPIQKILNDPTPRIKFDYSGSDDNITTYTEKFVAADRVKFYYDIEEYSPYLAVIDLFVPNTSIVLHIMFNENNGEKVTVGVKDQATLSFYDPANDYNWSSQASYFEVLKIQEPTADANGKIWIIGKSGDSDGINFVYVNELIRPKN